MNRRLKVAIGSLLAAVLVAGPAPRAQAQGGLDPAYLDQLLAPVALYPDQLLAQMLLCSGNARKVSELSAWLKKNPQLKGTELQKAVEKAGFEPSFIALAPFPQVIELMAGNIQWTSQIGGAFAVDKEAVFDSIQRLRAKSKAVGNLKTTAQQKVETRTVEGGEQVIVIEPANPQVVYVPQYNPQVVYTQPAATTTTVVVVEDDDDDEEAALAGAVIGFTAGVVIGSAWNNSYYYGPYGYRGGAYMYGGGWNDWYDDREDMREDYYENREDAREDYADHREDMSENRNDRAEDARESRGERSENTQEQRTERRENASEQRTERTGERSERTGERSGQAQQQRAERSAARDTSSASASTQSASRERTRSAERTGTRSDAFSGYSSGSSTRSASERGSRSRSSGSGRSSGGRSGGGRSGGGRRR